MVAKTDNKGTSQLLTSPTRQTHIILYGGVTFLSWNPSFWPFQRKANGKSPIFGPPILTTQLTDSGRFNQRISRKALPESFTGGMDLALHLLLPSCPSFFVPLLFTLCLFHRQQTKTAKPKQNTNPFPTSAQATATKTRKETKEKRSRQSTRTSSAVERALFSGAGHHGGAGAGAAEAPGRARQVAGQGLGPGREPGAGRWAGSCGPVGRWAGATHFL